MSETRHCKGYLVNCKNPAVKGRLFCFTCAGRKSRNKKTMALETSERDVKELRSKLEDLTAELEHWKSLAEKLREEGDVARQELKSIKKSNSAVKSVKELLNEEAPLSPSSKTSPPQSADTDMEIDISCAASALLSIGTPIRKTAAFISSHPASNPIEWRVPFDASISTIAPAAL